MTHIIGRFVKGTDGKMWLEPLDGRDAVKIQPLIEAARSYRRNQTAQNAKAVLKAAVEVD
jgi:hypothetical protein